MNSNFVSNALLTPAITTKFINSIADLFGQDYATVSCTADPSTTTAFIAVPNIVGVSSILKVLRIHALTIVALVAADIRPVIVPEKEGQAMRQDALLVAAKLTVPRLMQETSPFPAPSFSDGGSGLNVALRERLDVHEAILPHFNA